MLELHQLCFHATALQADPLICSGNAAYIKLEPHEGFAPSSIVYKTITSLSMFMRHLKLDGAVGFEPTSCRFKGGSNRPLYDTPIKMVAVVGIEPTEPVRATDLQSVLPP